MGFQDRDYSRPSRSGFPSLQNFGSQSITTWLIGINVAVFLLELINRPLVYGIGEFTASAAIWHLQIWRFITFQFIHASPQHIFFNMLGLYFFGPMIETYLNRHRFLVFYLLCGAAGAALFLVLMMLGILPSEGDPALVGASAGIFGILIAAARVAPDTTVMLLFPPIPMKLRTLAWILIGIAAVTVLGNFNNPRNGHYANAGGEAAHLGGAILGYFLIQRPALLDRLTTWPRRRPPGTGWKMDDWR